MASSSSSSMAGNHGKDEYEVFISFRGDDVRRSFLSHLNRDLKSKQVQVFVDNDLERGKDINESLLRTIEGSALSIVIFSPNYPKSEWCLGELEKIHESKEQRNQIVVPVFYKVDPSDVQELKGNYAIPLQKWRDALVEVSNLSGFVSRDTPDDAKLIENIVADVDRKLSELCPIVSHEDGLFGIDSSVKDIMGLLHLDSTNDVRMVGIWGMGGLGKTTRASKVFDTIKNNFDGHCFVANVKDKLIRENVTEKIVQELLKDKNISIGLASSVGDTYRRRLGRVKVLLVLDDVDTSSDLNALLKSCSCASFSPGSRIIVTSRDSQVMRSVTFESEIYEVKQLENDEALRLLSWHSFGRTKPQQGYEKILEAAVRYAHGVPLALVVLGSELRGKEIQVWENALEKFNKISPLDIQRILRISYNGLDREEKKIFLDVACFFNHDPREDLEYILECFGFHASIGIDRLIDKSLLKVEKSHYGKHEVIGMHDLLAQMGKEILAEEKESKGQQSRLWEIDEIEEAFTDKASGLRQLPSTIGSLTHLKELSLSNCRELESLPSSISSLLSLETISLEGCRNLKELPEDFGNLKSLKELDASYSGLIELPQSIQNLQNLRKLLLYYCDDLIQLPEELGNLKSLEDLDVSHTFITKLPQSTQNLQNLIQLILFDCIKLQHLPPLPPNLEVLYAPHLLYEESSQIIEQCKSKVNSQPTKVHRLYVSGSQVPRWMKYHNECGSSVSLDLETVDLIFCVVLSSESYRGHPDISKLVAVLQISETEHCTERFLDNGLSDLPVVCGPAKEEEECFYVVLWTSKPNCKFVKKVSFFFQYGVPKIIKCGVHPIVNIRNDRKRKYPNNLNVEVDSEHYYYDLFEQMGQETVVGEKESSGTLWLG